MEILYILNGVEHSLPVRYNKDCEINEMIEIEQSEDFLISSSNTHILIPSTLDFEDAKSALRRHPIWWTARGYLQMVQSSESTFFGFVYSDMSKGIIENRLSHISNILNKNALCFEFCGDIYTFDDEDDLPSLVRHAIGTQISNVRLILSACV